MVREMKKADLAFEKQTVGAFENGKLRSISPSKAELRKYRLAARATFIKNRRVNIRLSSSDLMDIQARALEEGVPYQTLIASVLHKFVSGRLVEVNYNGQRIGIVGYREMLARDFSEIPDLYFDIELLISDPPYIASRLRFQCMPKEKFLGLSVNGKRISFSENVFYEFHRGRIAQVWSVIDKAAIEAQL